MIAVGGALQIWLYSSLSLMHTGKWYAHTPRTNACGRADDSSQSNCLRGETHSSAVTCASKAQG
eukprot:3566707-Rhodomonas_salina.3